MRRNKLVYLLAFIPTLAFAQPQQPDTATLQKALAILQAQRNAALDAAASAELKAAQLAEENAKLKAESDDLKKKAAPEKP